MPKLSKEVFAERVGKYFPPEAVDYAFFYFNHYQFHFKVTQSRTTKKGDFKYSRDQNKTPIITVNGDLCSYDFLLVYIHELAHYMIYKYHDIFKMKSHGDEWKKAFKGLLINLLEQVVLPDDIKTAFHKYSHHIKSSTANDRDLEQVLDGYRNKPEGIIYLKDLREGEQFVCRNELFRLDSFARTRARCTLLRNNRKYLISDMMNVKKWK